MDTTYNVAGSKQANAANRRRLAVFNRWWASLREWRGRERLRARLSDLSDRELGDIGITRAEIDFVTLEFEHPTRAFQVRPDWYEEYWLKPSNTSPPAETK